MPRRKRSTFGTIERLSGRDHWNLKWWETRDGVHARRSTVVWGTRREAERRLAEIRAGLDETDRGTRQRLMSRMTVGEAYERWWLPAAQERIELGTLASRTFKCRLSKWKLYVGPQWADVPCADVRPLDIQRWLTPTPEELARLRIPKAMTKKPAEDALAILRQVLDLASTYEVVGENVARRSYRMPMAHADLKDGAYTLAQLDAIATVARGAHTEAAMLLMMFASCRTGESLGARLSECSLAEWHGLRMVVVEVVRQVNSDASISPDGTLKNRQSVRPVVVPPPWSGRLWELVEAKRAAGDAWLSDGGFGRPCSQNLLRREWTKAVEEAGLPPKAARAARRSWETYMRWEMGVSPDRVERMMGHALPGVTGAHYDKPTAEMFVSTVGEAFERRPFFRSDSQS